MGKELFLRCRFHPYSRNHYLLNELPPRGPVDFRVPWPSGKRAPGPASHELAALKDRPECPEWARKWKDEFYIEILNREDFPGE